MSQGIPIVRSYRVMAIIRVVVCIFFAFIAGGCSQVVTEKLHVSVFPDPSVATYVTIVVPTGNSEPLESPLISVNDGAVLYVMSI